MTATVSAPSREDITIDQRGRAELEFLRGLRGGLAPVKAELKTVLEDSGVLDAPFTDIKALRQAADEVLDKSAGQRQRMVGAVLRWSRTQSTPRAVAAFERNRDRLESEAVPLVGSVEDRLGDTVPRYWDYEFHGTTGGWDGHEHMGFIHHELVYQYLLVAAYGPNIFATRGQVAEAAPEDAYERILDLGCGTGQYTMKLAEVYPEADITGVDVSRASLNYALRRGADAGHNWRMVRAAAENTGLPAETYDLVTSFILLHEVPPHVTRKILAESFRLLVPGGAVHFSDVVPYRERSTYQAWADDWDAENGNEPWWRTAATADLSDWARDAGFVEVHERGLGPGQYPWVMTARKPRG